MRIVGRLDFIEKQARQMIANQVRWPSGGGDTCAFDNSECKRIADEIAAREAPRLAEETRGRMVRVLGAQLERTMGSAQIQEASNFFGGDAGRALIGSFMAIDERTFAGIEGPFALMGRKREDLAAEFARRTQHLPRAQIGGAPVVTIPVPSPPPPPPRR